MMYKQIECLMENIRIIKTPENLIDIEHVSDMQLTELMHEAVHYIKTHTPFSNIKSFIREYKLHYAEWEKSFESIVHVLLHSNDKEKDSFKILEILQYLQENLYEGRINLLIPDDLNGYKLYDNFYWRLRIRIIWKARIYEFAIDELEKFIAPDRQFYKLVNEEKDLSKYNNSQIAIAYSVLYYFVKDNKYNLTEKNAKDVLSKYSQNKSIPALMRAVSENKSIEALKFVHKKNKTIATKKRDNLDKAKDLIKQIAPNDITSISEIESIIQFYNKNYELAYPV